METYRLKQIVLLILLLLNIFLAILLLTFKFQQFESQRALRQELYTLYTSQSISLSAGIDTDEASPPLLSIKRDPSLEAQIAAFVLGEETEGVLQGGGIYSYSGDTGAIRFRSTGAFDYVPSSPHVVSDRTAFMESFCKNFGYTVLTQQEQGSTCTYTAAPTVDGYPVHNAALTVRFVGERLLSLSGSCFSLDTARTSPKPCYGAADALVLFLNYRTSDGAVCSEVLELTPLYTLKTAAAAPDQLSPTWRITTDASPYYVDAVTGTVTRG